MLKRSPGGNKEMHMQRRDFLKYSAALGVASALP
ncbi:twin-arginine translocation signal domain-containing protein, partial [Escherichia coli]